MKRTVTASVLTLLSIVTGDPLNAQRGADQVQRGNVFLQIGLVELPLQEKIFGINMKAVPLRECLSIITKASGLRFSFAPTIESLDRLCTVSVTAETVERALTQVLEPNKLAFVVLQFGRVFIFPNTPAERQKYAQSIREFEIVKADTSVILMFLNRATVNPDKPLAMEPDGQRPLMASDAGSRTIVVRATADVMDRIAKIIAEYDK